MKCSHINVGGVSAIVCGSERIRSCVKCGKPSTRLCDWKMGKFSTRTCDKPICDDCAYSPAEGKDLCPDHRKAWEQHPRNK